MTRPAIPLRARKQAQTKLALMQAAIDRLDQRTLEAIPVKELCGAAGISEASFFNYFPKKTDLLVFFVQLWSLDLAWQVQQLGQGATAFAGIETVFRVTAGQIAAHPGLMAEVLADQARRAAPPVLRELNEAERVVAYPDRPGIEHLPAAGLDSLLPPLLQQAVASGELPRDTDMDMALLGLAALFFGVPAVMRSGDPAAYALTYRHQLQVYWAGLQHRQT